MNRVANAQTATWREHRAIVKALPPAVAAAAPYGLAETNGSPRFKLLIELAPGCAAAAPRQASSDGEPSQASASYAAGLVTDAVQMRADGTEAARARLSCVGRP